MERGETSKEPTNLQLEHLLRWMELLSLERGDKGKQVCVRSLV